MAETEGWCPCLTSIESGARYDLSKDIRRIVRGGVERGLLEHANMTLWDAQAYAELVAMDIAEKVTDQLVDGYIKP